MTTADLNKEGFFSWGRFSPAAKSDLLGRLPNTFGVYIIRTAKAANRIRGASDIVYIGSACNQNGLKGGIRQYFSPGPTQSTNKRIMAVVAESDDYEIGWLELGAKSEAVGLEQRLLENYFKDHGERPPQNLKG